jgi:hypothetical protein
MFVSTMIRKVEIPTTGGWSNWQEYVINVNLNAGNTYSYEKNV